MTAPLGFEIDGRLLAECDALRRAELLGVVAELVASEGLTAPAGSEAAGAERLRLVLRNPRAACVQAHESGRAEPLASRDVPWSALRRPIADYRAVIERITAGGYHVDPGRADSRFEALDHGKRLVHDDAAETLSELLDGFVELSEEAARSLFTLLFLVRSELPAHVVRYHRAHGLGSS